jgi:hypothetical protein
MYIYICNWLRWLYDIYRSFHICIIFWHNHKLQFDWNTNNTILGQRSIYTCAYIYEYMYMWIKSVPCNCIDWTAVLYAALGEPSPFKETPPPWAWYMGEWGRIYVLADPGIELTLSAVNEGIPPFWNKEGWAMGPAIAYMGGYITGEAIDRIREMWAGGKVVWRKGMVSGDRVLV